LADDYQTADRVWYTIGNWITGVNIHYP